MEKQEIEIDLKEIFLYLYNHLYIIILSALIGAMVFYLFSSLMLPKQYKSSARLYVLNQQNQQTVTYNDLQTGTQLTKDYAKLITSQTVTAKVIADLDLQNQYEDMRSITPGRLAEMIKVEALSDTRVIQITVTDVSPTRAQDIAEAVRIAASERIYEVMAIEAVNVVDTANLPEGAHSPNTMKNTVIGGAFGFVLVAAIYIVIFLLDDTIKTPDDVEKYLGLSVLAAIPYDEEADMAVLRKRANKRKKKKGRSSSSSSTSNVATETMRVSTDTVRLGEDVMGEKR